MRWERELVGGLRRLGFKEGMEQRIGLKRLKSIELNLCHRSPDYLNEVIINIVIMIYSHEFMSADYVRGNLKGESK